MPNAIRYQAGRALRGIRRVAITMVTVGPTVSTSDQAISPHVPTGTTRYPVTASAITAMDTRHQRRPIGLRTLHTGRADRPNRGAERLQNGATGLAEGGAQVPAGIGAGDQGRPLMDRALVRRERARPE